MTLPRRSIGTAYGLWFLSFVGVCGVHRLYAGKIGTGLLWVFTFGLFGVGQFIDLFLIPSMVDDFNLKQIWLRGGSPPASLPSSGATLALPASPAKSLKGQPLMREIIRLAQQKQGILTVNEAIAQIEADFDEIETAFVELVKRGYAYPDNHGVTGAVEYHFPELERLQS